MTIQEKYFLLTFFHRCEQGVDSSTVLATIFVVSIMKITDQSKLHYLFLFAGIVCRFKSWLQNVQQQNLREFWTASWISFEDALLKYRSSQSASLCLLISQFPSQSQQSSIGFCWTILTTSADSLRTKKKSVAMPKYARRRRKTTILSNIP